MSFNSIVPSQILSNMPSNLSSNLPSNFPQSNVPSNAPPSNAPSNMPVSYLASNARPSNVPSQPTSQSMSTSSSNTSSQNTNEQLLSDIKSLQSIEQELFNSLENNGNLTSKQQQQIIDKINSISQMRVNLYETLGNISSLYENAVSNSQNTLSEQTRVISVVENQLNQAKQKLQVLEAERNNKIRLIEINEYYGEKYSEHGKLMKYIIFMMIPIIIISFLYNKGLLPKMIYFILLGIIAVIGSIFIVYRLLSIWNRDNMNYQEYLWSFNPSDAPSTVSNGSGSSNDPWVSKNSNGTCIGDDCCSNGMTFDTATNQCVSPCTSNSSSSSRSSSTETFINNVFTKKSSLYKKPDVTLNNIIYPSNF